MSAHQTAPDDSPGPLPCPHCGTVSTPGALYCAQCGARLVPIETQRMQLKIPWLSMLLLLPAISVAALGSCVAGAIVVGGLVFRDWKVVIIASAAAAALLLLGLVLRGFQR